MKNITKIIIALFAIVAFSCTQDDVENRPVITPTDAPVLTAPTAGAIYELAPANATATAERFTWDSADFGGDVEVTYAVQMDKKGGDFSAPQTLGSVVSQNQVAVTVEVMNGAALKLKATPFIAADFIVRVVATTGTSTSITSEPTAIVVKPYSTEAPKLWIPGGYQAASGYGSDWTPATAPQLAATGYGKTDFEGYAYINNAAAAFKFTPQSSGFDGDYGDAVGPDGVYSGKLLQTGEKNAGLPNAKASYYLIKADTDPAKLTYTLTETKWGVIGSATAAITGGDGWGNDVDMTYDSAKKTWSVTMNLSANEIKFRANDAWVLDLGQSKTGAAGDLAYGGDSNNIVVPSAGNYTITLNLSSPRSYKYILTKN